ncbi:hypothetical protein FXB41_32140 [Bradyrhizobium canariense]|uniref:hypothetical protein n=1 Tax=Bradyrhizobium canariense TaxID=255045 RepID=UPI001CA4C723|nr:hypothetical protein [Bradyrhizobium canariense]MBW5439252.1 hypothetical protein [Bradyrhizobium canariense]
MTANNDNIIPIRRIYFQGMLPEDAEIQIPVLERFRQTIIEAMNDCASKITEDGLVEGPDSNRLIVLVALGAISGIFGKDLSRDEFVQMAGENYPWESGSAGRK